MSVWKGGLWASQRYPNGGGPWKGGLWRSQRLISPTQRLINTLFGNGEQGVFYVPQPVVDGQQVLFTDAAGTIPVTAADDPVGLMLDLSGNGNHATQTTSAARPIYRTDGALHWLEFDGVDDTLLMPDDIGISGNPDSTALITGNSKINDKTTLSLGEDGPGNRVTLRRKAGGLRIEIGSAGYESTLPYGSANSVIGYRFSGSRLGDFELFLNSQSEQAQGTEPVSTALKSNVIGDNPAAPQHLQGNVFGLVIVNQYLTDDLLVAAKSYLANLSGVQL